MGTIHIGSERYITKVTYFSYSVVFDLYLQLLDKQIRCQILFVVTFIIFVNVLRIFLQSQLF